LSAPEPEKEKRDILDYFYKRKYRYRKKIKGFYWTVNVKLQHSFITINGAENNILSVRIKTAL